MSDVVTVSTLGKTWVLDLDGTVVKHNGYKLEGHDTLLNGAKAFLASISPKDMVVFITSRTEEYREMTEAFLRENGIRYEAIIYGAPYGERIIVNDRKPSGLNMALAVNLDRDKAAFPMFYVDEEL